MNIYFHAESLMLWRLTLWRPMLWRLGPGHDFEIGQRCNLHMGIFDELYPGVKKFKVQDGIFFEMGTSRETFGAP